MGLSEVYTELRPMDLTDSLGADEMDVAYATIHHSHNPAKNFIYTTFKIPALAMQMPRKHAEEIEDTYHYPALHRMKFNKVENHSFHSYMRKEGMSTVDKIRRFEGNKVTTYYFSSVRRIGMLPHDYTMAMIVYLNYPTRFFTRRTPCKKLDPKCMPGCADILKEPIVHWLDDPEPNTARLDKFFFTYAGENHRLCLGYTIENIKDNDNCFEPIEPDYYTLDLNVKYFKEAIWDRRRWEQYIINERKGLDEEMYAIYDGGFDDGVNGEALIGGSVTFRGYSGTASLVKYNYYTKENVPEPLFNALENNIFSELWRFDMKSLNSRNSIHKWTYNHWVEVGNLEDNGWWCSWDASETIANAGDTAAGLGDGSGAVEGQLNQVANIVGWGSTGDTSSSDTEYDIIIPKYNAYEYTTYTEPLPDRKSSLF